MFIWHAINLWGRIYSFGFRTIFYSMIQSVQLEFANHLKKPTTQFNSMTFQYGQKSQNFIEELDRLQMTKVTKLYWRTWSITKQLDRQFWTRVGSKTSIGVVFVSCPDKQILSTSLSPPPKLTAKLFSAICVLHPHSTLVDFICKSCKWDIFLWAVGIIY